MPLAIVSMGVLFNLLNGYMQGKWIFYLAPRNDVSSRLVHFTVVYYRRTALFAGMLLNWQSDYIIRHCANRETPGIICLKKECTVMSLPPTISAR